MGCDLYEGEKYSVGKLSAAWLLGQDHGCDMRMRPLWKYTVYGHVEFIPSVTCNLWWAVLCSRCTFKFLLGIQASCTKETPHPSLAEAPDYRIMPNKHSCMNKCTPALSDSKIDEHGWKMGRNGWKTYVLFLGGPWAHLDVCLHTGSIYSALYGIPW